MNHGLIYCLLALRTMYSWLENNKNAFWTCYPWDILNNFQNFAKKWKLPYSYHLCWLQAYANFIFFPLLSIVQTPNNSWKFWFKKFCNIASKFVKSIKRALYSYYACSWRQQTNPSRKKVFHQVENVIKQLVHTSAVHSSRYEALGKFGEHSRS